MGRTLWAYTITAIRRTEPSTDAATWSTSSGRRRRRRVRDELECERGLLPAGGWLRRHLGREDRVRGRRLGAERVQETVVGGWTADSWPSSGARPMRLLEFDPKRNPYQGKKGGDSMNGKAGLKDGGNKPPRAYYSRPGRISVFHRPSFVMETTTRTFKNNLVLRAHLEHSHFQNRYSLWIGKWARAS